MCDSPTSPRPPRLWLVNLFFGPGVAPTGQLAESLAVELSRHGVEVQVLTGTVAYQGTETAESPRFTGRIHRIYSGPVHARRMLGKLCSWSIFYLGLALFLVTRRLPDKVVLMTTPPFLQCLFAARNVFTPRPAELILWNQDTYPEILAAFGVLRERSWLLRLLHAVQSRWNRRIEKAVALDHSMAEVLRRQGVREVRVIPNWNLSSPAEEISTADLDPQLIRRMQEYRYRIIYTGNLGRGHDLSSVWQYLRQHPGQRDFLFLFLGGGEQWEQLSELARSPGGEAIEMLSYVPQEQYQALLRAADFGLVALDACCVGLMSPSKIHGYLAAGKPLIYLGPNGSNIAEAIENFGCGWCIPENEPAAFETCLRTIVADEFNYATLQQQALVAADTRYSESRGTRELCEYILGRDVDKVDEPPVPGNARFAVVRPALDEGSRGREDADSHQSAPSSREPQ